MVLDSCCGSGDIAQIASEVVGRKGRVVGLDFSKDMLTYARGRVSGDFGPYDNIEWVQGDAMEYPYADGTFSAATMGYGLRNVSDRALALRELSRVLKRGAYASILDFNNARGNDMVDGVQGFLLQNVVVPVAENAGVGDQYRYLRPSIEGYPTGSELEQLALANGFSQATFYEIGLGFMGCLVCRK
jgi:demethylmenaquinone methyltransferase/2-methoxy-6-polyprenyl-1,4-benzoquinol methylase